MRLLLPFTLLLSTAALLTAQPPAGKAAPAPPMTMTVAGFPDGGMFAIKYTQSAPNVPAGEGLSPAITWTNVPAGTQSFFLHMHDLELARNKTTDDQPHWVFWNIPGNLPGLPEGVPKGSQSLTVAIRSAPLAPCIAAREPRPTAPCITTCLSSTRWISSWT